MPEILWHPLRGTAEIGSERIMPVCGTIRAAEGASDETPIIRVQATDGTEDRHGTPLDPQGWNFDPFKRNPCALWSHGEVAGWPSVGIVQDIRGLGAAWDFDVLMLKDQWEKAHFDVNMPTFLWEVYRDFGLGAVSVAFIPKEWEPYEATSIPSFFGEGVRYKRQELTEVSFVNVPSNRNALAKGMERYRAVGKGDALAKVLGMPTVPIVVQARAADDDAKAKRAPVAKLRLLITNTRESLRDCWDPCCAPTCVEYCDLCYSQDCDCDEVLSAEEMAAEQTALATMIEASAEMLAVALSGWETSEHRMLRDTCSWAVQDSMWRIDRLLKFQDYWYPEAEQMDTMAVPADQMRKFVAYVESDKRVKDMLVERAAVQSTRIGAEISAKNQARIRKIHSAADDIAQACADMLGMDTMDTEKTTPNLIRINTSGSRSDRDESANQLIRVSATDDAAAGAGDRSNHNDQRDLYGSGSLRVRHN